MTPAELAHNFGNPVAYYPGLVKPFGGVSAVILFCQFFYWTGKESSELGIFKTADEIQAETGLSYEEQLTARKKLKSCGILIETHKRLEHKIYYRINADKLNEILTQAFDFSPNGQSPVRETGKVHFGKPEKSISRAGHSPVRGQGKTHFDPTENTTENTNKTFCPVSEQPDAEDGLTSQAKQVLTHLNTTTGARFRACKSSLEPVRARLREGFKPAELMLVTDFKAGEWLGSEQAQYLRPSTLFSPQKFPGYLAAADRWQAAGRPKPMYRRGVRDRPADPLFRASYDDMDYSATPEGFRS